MKFIITNKFKDLLTNYFKELYELNNTLFKNLSTQLKPFLFVDLTINY